MFNKFVFSINFIFLKYLSKYIKFVYYTPLFLLPTLFNNTLFYKYIYRYIIVFLLTYLLMSMFIYLNKYYRYNKYTSVIQRFWKRTFILFWIMEFFTFSIFVFVTLTHFNESLYFLDWTGLNMYTFNSSLNYIFICIILCNLIIFNYFLLFFKKINNNIICNTLLLVILILLFVILYYEFCKIFYVVNYYHETEKSLYLNIKYNNMVNFNENEIIRKTRTVYHYLNLFIMLKFWHVFFIFNYFCFFIKKYNNTNTLSYDSISSNHANFVYLFIFNLFFYMFVIKYLLYANAQYSYFWFFVNTNFVIFFYNVWLESSIFYFVLCLIL